MTNRMQEWEEAVAANPYVPPVETPQTESNGHIQAEPEHPRILPPRDPLALRAMAWALGVMNKPTLTALVIAMLTWPVKLLMRGLGTPMKPGPLRVWLGGKVSPAEYVDRMMACAGCSAAFWRLNGKSRGPLFCGTCGCGEWFGAQLRKKNRYAKWHCPRGKHKDTKYPMQEFMDAVPENDRRFISLTLPGQQRTGGCGAKG